MKNNGLSTFTIHAADPGDQPALSALRDERPGFPAFAGIAADSLTSTDPETAARQHLQLALASDSVPLVHRSGRAG